MAASDRQQEAEIITDKNKMCKWSRGMRSQGKTIGLVPTMGYLHEGHLSLIKESHSHKRTDLTVVSIYVKPSYCRESDCIGETASCLEVAGAGHETWVRVERLEKGMCGNSRPVFFRGVATVVTKLFNIVEPDVAVFGKKDYQQWRLIQRMVRDLDFSIEIIGSEIVRDNGGLAMSSRNVRLSPEERKQIVDQEILEAVEEIKNPVVICVAAWFGNVWLIDNMEINL